MKIRGEKTKTLGKRTFRELRTSTPRGILREVTVAFRCVCCISAIEVSNGTREESRNNRDASNQEIEHRIYELFERFTEFRVFLQRGGSLSAD